MSQQVASMSDSQQEDVPASSNMCYSPTSSAASSCFLAEQSELHCWGGGTSGGHNSANYDGRRAAFTASRQLGSRVAANLTRMRSQLSRMRGHLSCSSCSRLLVNYKRLAASVIAPRRSVSACSLTPTTVRSDSQSVESPTLLAATNSNISSWKLPEAMVGGGTNSGAFMCHVPSMRSSRIEGGNHNRRCYWPGRQQQQQQQQQQQRQQQHQNQYLLQRHQQQFRKLNKQQQEQQLQQQLRQQQKRYQHQHLCNQQQKHQQQRQQQQQQQHQKRQQKQQRATIYAPQICLTALQSSNKSSSNSSRECLSYVPSDAMQNVVPLRFNRRRSADTREDASRRTSVVAPAAMVHDSGSETIESGVFAHSSSGEKEADCDAPYHQGIELDVSSEGEPTDTGGGGGCCCCCGRGKSKGKKPRASQQAEPPKEAQQLSSASNCWKLLFNTPDTAMSVSIFPRPSSSSAGVVPKRQEDGDRCAGKKAVPEPKSPPTSRVSTARAEAACSSHDPKLPLLQPLREKATAATTVSTKSNSTSTMRSNMPRRISRDNEDGDTSKLTKDQRPQLRTPALHIRSIPPILRFATLDRRGHSRQSTVSRISDSDTESSSSPWQVQELEVSVVQNGRKKHQCLVTFENSPTSSSTLVLTSTDSDDSILLDSGQTVYEKRKSSVKSSDSWVIVSVDRCNASNSSSRIHFTHSISTNTCPSDPTDPQHQQQQQHNDEAIEAPPQSDVGSNSRPTSTDVNCLTIRGPIDVARDGVISTVDLATARLTCSICPVVSLPPTSRAGSTQHNHLSWNWKWPGQGGDSNVGQEDSETATGQTSVPMASHLYQGEPDKNDKSSSAVFHLSSCFDKSSQNGDTVGASNEPLLVVQDDTSAGCSWHQQLCLIQTPPMVLQARVMPSCPVGQSLHRSAEPLRIHQYLLPAAPPAVELAACQPGSEVLGCHMVAVARDGAPSAASAAAVSFMSESCGHCDRLHSSYKMTTLAPVQLQRNDWPESAKAPHQPLQPQLLLTCECNTGHLAPMLSTKFDNLLPQPARPYAADSLFTAAAAAAVAGQNCCCNASNASSAAATTPTAAATGRANGKRLLASLLKHSGAAAAAVAVANNANNSTAATGLSGGGSPPLSLSPVQLDSVVELVRSSSEGEGLAWLCLPSAASGGGGTPDADGDAAAPGQQQRSAEQVLTGGSFQTAMRDIPELVQDTPASKMKSEDGNSICCSTICSSGTEL